MSIIYNRSILIFNLNVTCNFKKQIVFILIQNYENNFILLA